MTMSQSTWRERNSFVYGLCFLLNLLPIFNVSVDSNFGTMNKNGKLRLSLVCLLLGDQNWYFFTFYDGKLCFFKKLRLSDVIKHYDIKNWDADGYKFDEFRLKLNNSEKNSIYKEFLQNRISESERSIDTSNSKVNTYLTVLSIIASFYIFSLKSIIITLDINTITILSAFICLFSGILMMYLFGLGMLIRHYLSVKSYISPSFSDIMNSATNKKFIRTLFQTSKSKAEYSRHQTTIVLNIQNYFWKSLILTIILLIAISLIPKEDLKKKSNASIHAENMILLNRQGIIDAKDLSSLVGAYEQGQEYRLIACNESDALALSKVLVEFNVKHIETQKLSNCDIKSRIVLAITKEK